MAYQLFDLQVLRNATDADALVEAELMMHFRHTIQRCVADGVLKKSPQQWPPLLHELRGAALSLGATALGHYCAVGEHATPFTPQQELAYREALALLAANTLQEIETALQG